MWCDEYDMMSRYNFYPLYDNLRPPTFKKIVLYLRRTNYPHQKLGLPQVPNFKRTKIIVRSLLRYFQQFDLWFGTNKEQEAQGLGALLDKMKDNDHINWITQRSRFIFHSKTCRFRDTKFLKIRSTPNDPRMTLITEVSKVPCVHWILTPEAQIALLFPLRSLVFHIVEVFALPNRVQWWNSKIR